MQSLHLLVDLSSVPLLVTIQDTYDLWTWTIFSHEIFFRHERFFRHETCLDIY